MKVGDLLEILVVCLAGVGTLLTVAGLVSWIVGAGVALLVVCPLLAYLAQVWATAELTSSRRDD